MLNQECKRIYDVMDNEGYYTIVEEDQNSKYDDSQLCTFENYTNTDWYANNCGYVELKEGIFYFDAENFDFRIIKLNNISKEMMEKFQEKWNSFYEAWKTLEQDEMYYDELDENEESYI